MKKIVTGIVSLILAYVTYAYNPPACGQSMFNLSNPILLTNASSSAGSGIFAPGPESIIANPALPAYEQRVQLIADFTGLAGDKFNAAFDTGILIPTKMFVISGLLNSILTSNEALNVGKSVNLKTGFSKEITEPFTFGFGVSGGFLWEDENSWSLGGDLGILYRKEKLGFLKDFRLGASVLNLGKYYGGTNLPGLDNNHKSDAFPSVATLKLGTAALFFENKNIKFGGSLDFNAPAFQNFVVDAGLQLGIKDTVFFNIAESIDVMEAKEGHYDFMPAIGIGVKFNFSASNNSYLKSHSWDKSEMLISGAWQQRYEKIHAISGGVKIILGQTDTEPPVIKIWDEE